ncbi:Peptidase propeptide and YPEB domain-containing protein [Thermodesulfobium acidiphilum]|uniref:Peptidase propeptide and YPEB domain-containing protein n=1 Tax=Thermodesulfobium acidiphilum TaxID=1794699 RepID=A0A2R4W233_THEAF|nr:PepSY domain-containing protein [Thermodesulfobium acidiphilum]AWB10780.1 Peptidase propeptide and YPEB domain-containing protein [Thermodesulfobium acidiphilum]
MNKAKKFAVLALGGILLTTSVAGIATANQYVTGSIKVTQDNEASYADLSNTTVDQAISSALAAQPGKVIKAKLEDENGTLVWNVDVVSNNQMYEVKVDAKDARVLSTGVDQTDNQKESVEEKD